MKFLFVLAVCLYVVAAQDFIVTKDLTLEEKATLALWTPENMKSATPMDLIIAELDGKVVAQDKTEIKYFNEGTRECQTPGVYPFATAGRLFFETARGRSSCSASSVGNDIVLTAGHCVSSGRNVFYKNFMFCPQYKDGNCVAGRYTGLKVNTHNEWHTRTQLGRDVAFMKVTAGLEAKVGALEMVYNSGRNLKCEAMGYPGNIGRGERMIQSSGVQSMGSSAYRPPTVKFPSKMTYGSSGGPWIVVTKSGKKNGVNGNVSHGNPNLDPNNFYSPYFDNEIQALRKKIEE
jgi:V8-like Glu-specific endopeptidase